MRQTAGTLAKLLKSCNGDSVRYESELQALLGYSYDERGFRCIKDPVLTPRQISIKDCAEAIMGYETLAILRDKPHGIRGGRANLVGEQVGGGALSPSHFSSINAWLGTTDGLLGAAMLQSYTLAVKMAREVVNWENDCRFQDNKATRYSIPLIPGTEDATGLQPGQEFPSVDMKGEFIRNNRMIKRGYALPITFEAAHFDQTSSLVEGAEKLTDRLGVIVEERVINGLFGIGTAHNTYKYNDVGTNTYLTTGAYTNKLSNQLTTEAASLDVAEQQLMAQTDPVSGLEIDVRDQRFLITTPFQRLTAHRLQNPMAGSVQVGSLTADDRYNTSAYITNLKVHISQRLVRLLTTARADYAAPLTATQAKYRWVYGDTQRMAKYRSARDITINRTTMLEAPELMKHDVFMEMVASEFGSLTIVEPRYCILNIKDS